MSKRRVYTGKIVEGQTKTSLNSLQPVLEELPKWELLADVLEEIEKDAYFNPPVSDGANGTILIMCNDAGTCHQLREYLQTMKNTHADKEIDEGDDQRQKPTARVLMRRKLRNYIKWKQDFAKFSANMFAENQKSISEGTDGRGAVSNKSKAPPNKRRRIRGGSSAGAGPGRNASGVVNVAGDREAHLADLIAELDPTDYENVSKGEIGADPLENMEDFFELFDLNDLLVVHPYDGDMDEHILEELKPRYIIMYEPDASFIRRVEVYRSSHLGRTVRVYFMYYGGSVEEQRYLSSVRKEKDAFTKLIRERGVSVTPRKVLH